MSRFAVHRPIFTLMVTLVVLLLGAIAFARLPIDLMPSIDFPRLTVATSYPNASPEEVEELITRPIEAAIAAVPGVEEFSSVSGEGQSQVRITFTWGTNLDAAANDIRDRLDRVRLPEEVQRPQLRKFDSAAFPIVIFGVSANLDPIELRRMIEEQVQVRLEQVPGVASADVWGGLSREIHVDLDADKIRALGLSIDEVQAVLRAQNVVRPAGLIERDRLEIRVRTPGDFRDLDELRRTIVAGSGAETVYLQDIAEVRDRWERERQRVRINGEPGIRLGVRKQSDTNTVEVARAAIAAAERLSDEIPQIQMATIIDTSDYIQRAIDNIARTVLFGGLLALVVLLVFLRNLRTTLVIAVSIPVAIIASFALLYFGGLTLNIMTLGGLALGVGMLLDNSIVVLENIFRRREHGESPKTAAINGANEVASAITASTLTTLAVFLPMVFVQGISGELFVTMATVVAFTLICSLIAALTLVPTLAARIPLKRPKPGTAAANWQLPKTVAPPPKRTSAIEATYLSVLDWALRRPLLTVLIALVVLGSSFFLVPLIGSEFMPEADEGEVRVNVELEVGAKLESVDAVMSQIEQIVLNDIPEVENVMLSAGGGGWRITSNNRGNLRISLVPEAQRTRSSNEVAADLRRRVADIPGAQIRVRAGGGLWLMRMGSRGADESLSIEIRGHDLVRAQALAEQVEAAALQVPGITDVVLSHEAGQPEELVLIDRERAQAMNVRVDDIARLLETVIGGSRVGYFRDAGTQVPIRLRVDEAEHLTVDEILDLTIRNRRGDSVSLRSVVEIVPAEGPTTIERIDQQRIIAVDANVADRDLGSVAADLQARLFEIPTPQGFSVIVTGDYEEQQEAFRELMIAIMLAVLLVFMVLACQFESLKHPLVVMTCVPFAIIGVLVMLFLTETTLNVQSLIGCMLLAGIVVNNAILLVNQSKQLLDNSKHELDQRVRTVYEAVREAGRRRLRPILMTTLTTVFGLMPLAIGLGEGGEAQAPMARAVIGGLLSSSLIVLVLIPVVYARFIRAPKQDARNDDE